MLYKYRNWTDSGRVPLNYVIYTAVEIGNILCKYDLDISDRNKKFMEKFYEYCTKVIFAQVTFRVWNNKKRKHIWWKVFRNMHLMYLINIILCKVFTALFEM